ncbi:hypothetical protein TWF788_002497 [Orbilia oligospora]|uniref:Rhodopsin domain-containing protein n=2 Tax=Orbilia oligospora TaxID=2813651 RepID=A0A7C8P6S4_ORBOL|nr:hypothetical protein TWF788_002497 [Orbilia oligospora]
MSLTGGPKIVIGYYEIPLAEKLSWPPPNTVNPPRRGHYLLPILGILLTLSTAATILRIYTRLFVVRTFGHDDILILPAYLAALSIVISEIKSLEAGWGLHVWDFLLEQTRLLVISGYSVQVSVGVCCWLTKMSILLSYLRFAQGKLRLWVKISLVFVTCWSIALLIPIILSCYPPHLYWDYYIRTPDMKCFSPFQIRILQYTSCSLNILSDVIILVLPIPTVWKLKMPPRQKWTCALIFMLWTIATIAAILRLEKTVSSFEVFDASWYGYDLWVYVALEGNLAVVCACAPGIKPLIVLIWPKFDKLHPSYDGAPPPAAPIRKPRGVVELIRTAAGVRASKMFSNETWGGSTKQGTVTSTMRDEEQGLGPGGKPVELKVQVPAVTQQVNSSQTELRAPEPAASPPMINTTLRSPGARSSGTSGRFSVDLPFQQFSPIESGEHLPIQNFTPVTGPGEMSPADTFGQPTLAITQVSRNSDVTIQVPPEARRQH